MRLSWPEPPSGAAVKRKPHVLIVDDEPNVRRVLSTLLEQAGWATTRAESGEQALDLVRAQDPDLVLTILRGFRHSRG